MRSGEDKRWGAEVLAHFVMFRFEKSDNLPCMLPLFRETLIARRHLPQNQRQRQPRVRERRRPDRIVGTRTTG